MLPPSLTEPLAQRIEQLLPQTQCAACGYSGCKPFAAALAAGETSVDACAPGGLPLTRRLQKLLGLEPAPPAAKAISSAVIPMPLRAIINEQECIGCTKCIEPCPVDAIIGAPKQLHSVIDEHCTGCGLCLPPCPVDCIELRPASPGFAWPDASGATSAAIREGVDIAACTACGECARVCPIGLAPAALARALSAVDMDEASALGLDRCTACGRCAEVCGENIPLVDYFRQGQRVMQAVNWQAVQAGEASRRQARRQARAHPDQPNTIRDYVARPAGPAEAQQEIAAVLARARERRASSGSDR